jgi:hypothetical protein
MFLPASGDETKLRQDETTFRISEDIRKPALVINPATKRAAKAQ